ncbi:MAG: Gfo/Idh/MocA family oxidoreductase [Clostridia bacterium]|nr:Gfo/Idh/MocA family oxidoreductase [Clostridia bacterium]
MFRIGIVGSDNSHADAFSKLINIPDENGNYRYPDCRVTAIFGLEKERTEEVATNGKIDYIAEKVEDLYDKVDAVMIVFRHGGLHAQYAMPFLERGIPVWLDKPFTISNEDCKMVMEASKKYNTILTGGSTCKFAYDVLMVKNARENPEAARIGKIRSAMMNFPATLVNDYGGIYFYSGHLAEMAATAFGYDMKSVMATENNGDVVAVLKYDNYQVVLNFLAEAAQNTVLVIGDKGVMYRELDISFVYRLGVDEFVNTLRTGVIPVSHEKLYKTVALLNAVKESYETGKEVAICGIND